MVCLLPTPRWNNPYRSGLLTATANQALQQTAINWGAATHSGAASFAYYNLFWSDDPIALFDQPRGFAHDVLAAAIPFSVAGDGYYFGVRAAQMGVAEDFSLLSNMSLNDDVGLYPDPVTSLASFSTTLNTPALEVISTAGFPISDGYLQIGDEVVLYSSIGINSGNPAFIISNWDPFGCNDGYTFATGESVTLFKGFEEENSVFFTHTDTCVYDTPVWADLFKPGIQWAENLGLGTVVRAHWNPATTPVGLSKTYYNVYWDTTLDNLFLYPKGITEELTATVTELHGGDGYYFGVRATYHPSNQAISSFAEISEDFYSYPETTVNDDDGYFFAAETGSIGVVSTTGFPPSGLLKIGSEILSYGATTATTFVITSRDSFGAGSAEDHANGSAVRFFRGFEDLNSSYQFVTPTWDADAPWLPPTSDGYASMQDDDGYRAWLIDNLNEDHSDFETENSNFPAQDELCSTYRANTTTLVNLYSGNQCGTYFGGREDGFGGGINLTESNLRRQETMLSLTGEPFVLLREKTTGRQCPRFSLHGEHTNERCAICYGTRILGGYDKYVSSRLYRPNIENPNGMISMRVSPYKNDLPMMSGRGLSQVDQLSIWVPAIPTIKKRDIIIRYLPFGPGETPIEEFRYEVLDVERNRLLFGEDGKQTLSVRKLDKTHVVMTYPVPTLPGNAI